MSRSIAEAIITYTPPLLKCTLCGVTDSDRHAVYRCDVCGDPVCSGCSENGRNNTVICDECGDDRPDMVVK